MPLTLVFGGSPLEKAVWNAILTRQKDTRLFTYSDLAQDIGKPKAVRAVASAVGRNPISYFIACHRVVHKNGDWGDYRWGSTQKRTLLTELHLVKEENPSHKPIHKPKAPTFGSGPTVKFPGWSLAGLQNELISRSHRSNAALERLEETLTLTRRVLEIPASHQVMFVPGSATGAMESAMWSFLGTRCVEALAWDVFGHRWQLVLEEALKIPGQRMTGSAHGPFPDLGKVDFDRDVIFTWNGSTSGVCVPDAAWIPNTRKGLTLCDATSAAYCMALEWDKLDVTAFSWQKGLGGEANQGVLVLGPRAIEHLETHPPMWPTPFHMSLRRGSHFHKGLTQGLTLNTPSLLCLEDCRQGHLWAMDIGGLGGLLGRVARNRAHMEAWMASQDAFSFSVKDQATRSFSTLCLSLKGDFEDPWVPLRRIADLLAKEQVAFDILNHGQGAPCLRVWCGPTRETNDLVHLTQWLDWAAKETLPP